MPLVRQCSKCGREWSSDEVVLTQRFCPNDRGDLGSLYDSGPRLNPGSSERRSKLPGRTSLAPPTLILAYVPDPKLHMLIRHDQTVGREEADVPVPQLPDEAEYKNISRQHAKFVRRNGKWYVQNLSQMNWTMVNGKKVADEEEAPVADGDTVILTYSAFKVSVGV